MKTWIATGAVILTVSSVAGAFAANTAAPYVGSWKARMTKSQLINQGFVDPRAVGVWKLVLNADGTYKTFNPLDKESSGTFTVAGSRIVFGRDDVACAQAGFNKKGFYRWSVKDRKLKLVAVTVGSDPCGGRWQTLTYPTWKRS